MNISRNKRETPTSPLIYTDTGSTKLIRKFSKFWFLCCCPNFWVDKVQFSDSFVKIYQRLTILLHIANVILCIFCLLSFWTQHDLSQSQESDGRIYIISACIITVFYHYVILYYTDDIRQVLYKLAVVLKVEYYDKGAEEEMIKQSKLYNGIFFCSTACHVVMVGLCNGIQAVTTDATFITCISAWPDIEDRSAPAGVTRVFVYCFWCLHLVRNMGVFLIMHTVLLSLCQQYKNLQSYFEDLNMIFHERELSQEEKEFKYEVKLKKGIEQHALTLSCVDDIQRAFQVPFCAHVVLLCGLLMLCLPEVMKSETLTWTLLASNLPRMAAALIGLGYFMWPAGDITVEASLLSYAIYSSGWEKCHGSSPRIMKLVVVSMMVAQRPIELKAFGYLTLSYETYVSIAKLSYSLFSVFH